MDSIADMPSGGPRFGYLPQLNGLRAVAIAVVVGYHLGVPLTWGGFLGVDLFLALSGFLITSILLKEQATTGAIRLGRFWIRRILRLFPAVIVMVAVVGIAWPIVQRDGDSSFWLAAIGALTYTANLLVSFGGLHLGALDPTWSLALEEQFYLIWPLALIAVFALKLRPRTTVAILAVLAVASFAIGALLFESRPDGGTPLSYYRPDARAGAILLGCAAAFIFSTDRGRRTIERFSWVGWVGLAGVLALVAFMPHDWPHQHAVFAVLLPLAAIFSTLFVAGLAGRTPILTPVLSWAPLVWVGNISYSLYLWHFPVFRVITDQIDGAAGKVVALAAAVAIAAASYYVVERPFLKLKDRFEPRARRPIASDVDGEAHAVQRNR